MADVDEFLKMTQQEILRGDFESYGLPFRWEWGRYFRNSYRDERFALQLDKYGKIAEVSLLMSNTVPDIELYKRFGYTDAMFRTILYRAWHIYNYVVKLLKLRKPKLRTFMVEIMQKIQYTLADGRSVYLFDCTVGNSISTTNFHKKPFSCKYFLF